MIQLASWPMHRIGLRARACFCRRDADGSLWLVPALCSTRRPASKHKILKRIGPPACLPSRGPRGQPLSQLLKLPPQQSQWRTTCTCHQRSLGLGENQLHLDVCDTQDFRYNAAESASDTESVRHKSTGFFGRPHAKPSCLLFCFLPYRALVRSGCRKSFCYFQPCIESCLIG